MEGELIMFNCKERNKDLREAKGNIPAWIIGEKLGIHEQSVYRLFRSVMSEERKEEVLKAIKEIKQEMKQQKKEIS